MRKTAISVALLLVALGLGGCSTRPREFVAQYSPPPGAEQAFAIDFETCRTLVRAGHRANFKQAAASGAVGAGAGFGTAVAVAPLSLAGGAGATAAAAAIPIIGIGIGFGMSRLIRSSRETKYKAALGNCLGEYGHSVQKWSVAKKRKEGDDRVAVADASPAEAK